MNVGSIVRARNVNALFWNKGVGCHGHVGFACEKGYAYVFLVLGVAKDAEEFDAIRILKAMGWTPPNGVGGKAPAVRPVRQRRRKTK